MKKKTKQNISKVLTIIGLTALCYLVFIDHRPTEYYEVSGSFKKYEIVPSLTRKRRFRHHIYIYEHPRFFSLEKNGKNYKRLERFFKNLPRNTPISLFIDSKSKDDSLYSAVVYKIIVNDSTVFDRMRINKK